MVQKLLAEMPRYELFAQKYKSDMQERCALRREQSLTCDAPTLNTLSSAYGEDAATAWIMAQMASIVLLTGVAKGDQTTTMQLTSGARVVLANYGHLKATELMLFCSQFKAGMYDHFYGTFDVLVITSSLNDFALHIRKEKASIAERRQREAREAERQRREHDDRLITYAEFLALKEKEKNKDMDKVKE